MNWNDVTEALEVQVDVNKQAFMVRRKYVSKPSSAPKLTSERMSETVEYPGQHFVDGYAIKNIVFQVKISFQYFLTVHNHGDSTV
jgi:hypothetical protein